MTRRDIDDQFHLANMCLFTGNSIQELIEKSKLERISEIRHIIIYFLHVDFDWKPGRIARVMNRNHASIYNSISRYKNLVDSSPEFRDTAAEYRDLIYEGFLSLAAIA